MPENFMPNEIRSFKQRFVYGQGAQQFAELSLPGGVGHFAVIVLLHGGFWRAPYDLTLMDDLADDLVARGYAVWNIEYRRVGDAGGGWPGTFQDVALATDLLVTLGISHSLNLKRVVAIGHSAGGHLALWLAARQHLPASEITTGTLPLLLAGVISLAGAVDLEQVWRLRLGNDAAAALLGGSPMELPERYQLASPAAQLPLGVPQRLIHGSADDRVPLIVSQDYVKHAVGAGDSVKLLELPGADHFVLIDPGSHAWKRTIEELKSLLKR
jgi:acetyl esterase/lipase